MTTKKGINSNFASNFINTTAKKEPKPDVQIAEELKHSKQKTQKKEPKSEVAKTSKIATRNAPRKKSEAHENEATDRRFQVFISDRQYEELYKIATSLNISMAERVRRLIDSDIENFYDE